MRVEKNLGEYTLVYYREEFHPITTDRPRVMLINHFSCNRHEERFVFDFQNLNEYHNFLNILEGDEIHYNVQIGRFGTSYNCTFTINNRTYESYNHI